MKYVAGAGLREEDSVLSGSGAHPGGFLAFQQAHEAAFSLIQSALLGLDGSRLSNLLAECRLRHGPLMREQARRAWHHWRDSSVVPPDEISGILVSLLPRHLNADEKLRLIRGLRRQMLDRIPRDSLAMTVAQNSDLTSAARRIVALMRRVRETQIPADFLVIQDWLTRSDMAGLNVIAQETEQFIAVERLAELLLHLAALWRVREQVPRHAAVHVQTTIEVPTACLAIQFAPSFWHETSRAADGGLLAQLQETDTLRLPSIERILQALTPDEQRGLHTLAVEEGLHIEVLLHEMRGKALLARQEMEMTIAAARRLEATRRHSLTVSEFETPAGSTRIEIGSAIFPLWVLHKAHR